MLSAAGDPPVEVLPGVELLPVEAMEWFAGQAWILGDGSVTTNDGSNGGVGAARTERTNRLKAVYLVDMLERLRARLAEAKAGILPPGFPDAERLDHLDVTGPTDAEFLAEQTELNIKKYERDLYHALTAMGQARSGLRATAPPSPLPDVLAAPLEVLGGDV
ncbi:hypothetical protein ACQEVI_09855 [Promicromonospora sp. CA-289599]|uniref:hypothetical protein n=1 Tax=Promicromonospora sp. CA-289599 TaxID=3240014 RepID=UPI003D8DFDD9